MSLHSRALTSCKERLATAEHQLAHSCGNEQTKSKKKRQVEMFRYILTAVQHYGEWLAAQESNHH